MPSRCAALRIHTMILAETRRGTLRRRFYGGCGGEMKYDGV
ncbi:hypothetical protein [Thioflexithrix psekupsensis]|nr:hypothetical protein [Thioflexithrix psekupsensis]